jgi:hypothetical protein
MQQLWEDGDIFGKCIGTDAAGAVAMGNDDHSVNVHGGDILNNAAGPDNPIAHNRGSGVSAEGDGDIGLAITQNWVLSAAMGIDLAGDTNGLVALPVIAATVLGSVRLIGTTWVACTAEIFTHVIPTARRAPPGTHRGGRQGRLPRRSQLLESTLSDSHGDGRGERDVGVLDGPHRHGECHLPAGWVERRLTGPPGLAPGPTPRDRSSSASAQEAMPSEKGERYAIYCNCH